MSGIGDKRARNERRMFFIQGFMSCRYKGLFLLPSCLVLSKGLSLLCSKGNDIFRPEGGECHLLGNKGA